MPSASAKLCPKCRAPITTLNYVVSAQRIGIFDFNAGHQDDPAAESIEEIMYCCPHCCEDLFNSEAQAMKLLSEN